MKLHGRGQGHLIVTFKASDIGLNLPCNRELDGLLTADPDGNSSVFLSCQSAGADNTSKGYWLRNVCPENMVFDFIKQQCRRHKYRRPPTLNIAILNNSCANGETCIGGTVCDFERLRCLCPYDTVPKLETLSCVKIRGNIPPKTASYAFNSFGNNEKLPSTSSGFIPNPLQSNVAPNFFGSSWLNFSSFFNKENSSNTKFNIQNNNDKQNRANYASIASQTPISNENANFYGNSASQSRGTNSSANKNKITTDDHKISGLPFTSQHQPIASLVFQPNFLATTTYPEPTRKITTLVRPGQSCRGNEICTGGSICTHPIKLCLCPGELEEKDGECVLPPAVTIRAIEGLSRRGNAPMEPITEGQVAQTSTNYSSNHLKPMFVSSAVSSSNHIKSVTKVPLLPSQEPVTSHYSTMTLPAVKPFVEPNHKIISPGSKQSGVGVTCSLNTDCMIGAYCNGNTNPPSCQCLSTHVNVDGHCERGECKKRVLTRSVVCSTITRNALTVSCVLTNFVFALPRTQSSMESAQIISQTKN
ncbi:hypothetical protein KIN20_026891 [Parelaphostrongylus tenuis]|uniref:EB domain-containing protein n=1 Tax=Parelaphostrongylus tenuis TaxID=148309 RepID=A0AAD5WD95_PARTN|nr:hypothetical protein KIN20_026891 [Parelaphostrongylus tenuis]